MNNNRIDVPKNIRQIGHTITNNKIYIEDYVMTYLKQLFREPFEKEKLLILVGRNQCEDDIKYLFIKGVIELDQNIKKYSEIMENDNIKKITRIREDFFYEEDIVGLGIIVKDEWLGFDNDIREYFHRSLVGDTVIIYDANEEESVYTFNRSGFVKEKGYYIYYDRNESMQNYMLCMKDGKSIEYGYSSTEIADRTIDEKIRSFTIPKSPVYTSSNINIDKYKNYIESKFGKKLRYCSVVICVAALLYIGLIKIEEIEKNTKRKARDLYEVTKEVMNQKNEILEIETIVEDKEKSNDNENKGIEIKEKNDEEKITENNKVKVKKEKNVHEDDIQKKQHNEKINVEKKNEVKNTMKKYYTVKKGDALVDISRNLYGTIKKVDAIKKMNGLKDEDKIYIGQRLVIP